MRQNLNKSISKLITPTNADTINRYYKDIAKIPLLTHEDEKELARRIAEGDQDAVDTLVKSNLRFSITVAKQYLNQGLDYQDLLMESATGLIIAAKRYNPACQTRFLTYAVWWMRKTIISAILDLRGQIRIPQSQQWSERKIVREIERKVAKDSLDPTNDYIAEKLNINENRVNDTMKFSISEQNPNDLQTDEDDGIYEHPSNDYMPDDDVEDEFDTKYLNKLLHEALSKDEQEVISMYFGMNGIAYTIADISKKMHKSIPEVKTLYDSAIKQLRKYLVK